MEILVPTTWNDVTVNQYQALSSLKKEDYKSSLKYTTDVILILCDLDNTLELPLEIVNQIAEEIVFASTEPKIVKSESFDYKDNKYNWIGNFNQLTVGEALSIEQTIDLEDLNFNQSYDVVLAVLLRKNGKTFDSKEFNNNRAEFGELPITEVLGMLLFFLNGGKIYTAGMKTYSITRTNTNTQKQNNRLKTLLLRLVQKVLRTSGYQ